MTATTDGPAVGDPGAPPRRVDFDRPLVNILGLPFDAIDVGQAVRRVRAAAFPFSATVDAYARLIEEQVT